MGIFDEKRISARRKFFALTGRLYFYGPSGELLCYVKQKMFRLKEDITVFAEEEQKTPLLNIKARQIIDFAKYRQPQKVLAQFDRVVIQKPDRLQPDLWVAKHLASQQRASLTCANDQYAFAVAIRDAVPEPFVIQAVGQANAAKRHQRQQPLN